MILMINIYVMEEKERRNNMEATEQEIEHKTIKSQNILYCQANFLFIKPD